jgi:hypothetical protein
MPETRWHEYLMLVATSAPPRKADLREPPNNVTAYGNGNWKLIAACRLYCLCVAILVDGYNRLGGSHARSLPLKVVKVAGISHRQMELELNEEAISREKSRTDPLGHE